MTVIEKLLRGRGLGLKVESIIFQYGEIRPSASWWSQYTRHLRDMMRWDLSDHETLRILQEKGVIEQRVFFYQRLHLTATEWGRNQGEVGQGHQMLRESVCVALPLRRSARQMKNKSVTIRPMQRGNFLQLLAYFRHELIAIPEYPLESFIHSLSAIYDDWLSGFLVEFSIDGSCVLGYATLQEESARIVDISFFEIYKCFRRRGWGSRTVQALSRYIQERWVKVKEIRVHPLDTEEAQEFWKSLAVHTEDDGDVMWILDKRRRCPKKTKV